MLQVRVWNEELFIRQSDFVQLPFTDEARNLTKTIPLQISEGAAAALKSVGDSVGSGGQILTIGILVLNLVASYSMNQILSQVRSLSMITHLQMMQLNVPPSAIIFFSALFEFVTFDIVPTDVVYGVVFAWDNVPYSESAENIGYESRQIIENTGSVPIFLLIIFCQQVAFAILVRAVKKQGRLLSYAQERREGFFYAGATDFFNETYINVCFAVCINTSFIAFGSTALMFNTVVALVAGIGVATFPCIFARKLSKAWVPLKPELPDEVEPPAKEESSSEESEEESEEDSGEEGEDEMEDMDEEESELGSEYYSENRHVYSDEEQSELEISSMESETPR